MTVSLTLLGVKPWFLSHPASSLAHVLTRLSWLWYWLNLRVSWNRGLRIFHKSRRHLPIVGVGRVTRSKLHTEGPQFWSYLRTSLLSGAYW
jgi:hypothetical protein